MIFDFIFSVYGLYTCSIAHIFRINIKIMLKFFSAKIKLRKIMLRYKRFVR